MSVARTAPVHEMGQRDFDTIVCNAIHEDLREERYPVRKLADAANVNERTAKNWWERRGSPQGLQLAKLVAVFPTLKAEYARICAMQTEFDPRVHHAIANLLQMASKFPGDGK